MEESTALRRQLRRRRGGGRSRSRRGSIPTGAYAYADFANGFYSATPFLVADVPGWGNFNITDSVISGRGLTSGTLGGVGVLAPTLAAAVQANFTIILDCVFNYTDFSILEIEPYDSPGFNNIWDFFYGSNGPTTCALQLDDFINNLAQNTTVLKASHPSAKIGFSCNHATGVASGAMTGEALITGTAIAGNRSPPRAAFTGIAISLQDSQTTHGNYIKTMTLYTPAVSNIALNSLVGN